MNRYLGVVFIFVSLLGSCLGFSVPSNTFNATVYVLTEEGSSQMAFYQTISQNWAIPALYQYRNAYGVELMVLDRGDTQMRYVVSSSPDDYYCREAPLNSTGAPGFAGYWDWLQFASPMGSCQSKVQNQNLTGTQYGLKKDAGNSQVLKVACLTSSGLPLWTQDQDPTRSIERTNIFEQFQAGVTVSPSYFTPPKDCGESFDIVSSKPPMTGADLLLRDENDGEDNVGTSVGCTPAPYGDVCISVNGAGLYVSYVACTREYYNPTFICDWSANVWWCCGSWDSQVENNCQPGLAYLDFWFNENFPSTQICCAFFQSGQQQGGSPCENITS